MSVFVSGQIARARRRGFTLLEVVVAVGLLTAVTVAIAAIFTSVGDTLTSGQRVSTLNRFAARVEAQMLADFDRIVREDGFLVIRNELSHNYAIDPDPVSVPLDFDDTSDPDGDGQPGRPRRMDELMFFADAGYSTKRPPLHREMIARASTARIYYGHGMRMPRDVDADGDETFLNELGVDLSDEDSRWARPRVDEDWGALSLGTDLSWARLGVPSMGGKINPNEFAGDWALLRHVTLLASRTEFLQDLPNEVFGLRPNDGNADPNSNGDLRRLADNTRQLQGQPAAQSIFRSVSVLEPVEPETFGIRGNNGPARLNPIWQSKGGGEARAAPQFTSGIVDIAVTDLAEIRKTVERSSFSQRPTTSVNRLVPYVPRWLLGNLGVVSREDYEFADPLFVNGFREVQTHLAQQRWMLDALPSIRHQIEIPVRPPYSTFGLVPSIEDPRAGGYRVRFEDRPPFYPYAAPSVVPNTTGTQSQDQANSMALAYEQADQEMLVSHVFLPRCSEFIVEWSFGISDYSNPETNSKFAQVYWHGLERFSNPNGTGEIVAELFVDRVGGPPVDSRPINPNQTPTYDGSLLNQGFRGFAGYVRDILDDGLDLDDPEKAMQEGLIRARNLVTVGEPQRGDPIAEYVFGYTDPSPILDNIVPTEVQLSDPRDDAEWPWPRLIRVTMEIYDPAAPDEPQRFQVVIEVPSRGAL